jgi:hypothetical protein
VLTGPSQEDAAIEDGFCVARRERCPWYRATGKERLLTRETSCQAMRPLPRRIWRLRIACDTAQQFFSEMERPQSFSRHGHKDPL